MMSCQAKEPELPKVWTGARLEAAILAELASGPLKASELQRRIFGRSDQRIHDALWRLRRDHAIEHVKEPGSRQGEWRLARGVLGAVGRRSVPSSRDVRAETDRLRALAREGAEAIRARETAEQEAIAAILRRHRIDAQNRTG